MNEKNYNSVKSFQKLNLHDIGRLKESYLIFCFYNPPKIVFKLMLDQKKFKKHKKRG